jgi:chemotaxis receptor (MCP) glutamine deamidase CheD
MWAPVVDPTQVRRIGTKAHHVEQLSERFIEATEPLEHAGANRSRTEERASGGGEQLERPCAAFQHRIEQAEVSSRGGVEGESGTDLLEGEREVAALERALRDLGVVLLARLGGAHGRGRSWARRSVMRTSSEGSPGRAPRPRYAASAYTRSFGISSSPNGVAPR